jgi:hypothetical protein
MIDGFNPFGGFHVAVEGTAWGYVHIPADREVVAMDVLRNREDDGGLVTVLVGEFA